jgi:hypothetical protein
METGSKYFESDDDEVLSAEILEFAHGYQSNDFPNPKREGCPAKEDLLTIANSGALPKAEIREHLLGCSPCFLDFHAARQAASAAPAIDETGRVKQKSSWLAFFLRPFPAGAFALLVCALAGLVWYISSGRNSTEIARLENVNQPAPAFQKQPAVPDAANLPAENKASILDNAPSKQNNPAADSQNRNAKTNFEDETKPPARKTVNLDLAKAAVLRNQTSSETVYSLPPQAVALNVKLPAKSPAGVYEVSLLDEFGKPLVKNLTKQSDGKNLTVNLNLRNSRGRARLCIAPKGEIPDCFAITIGHAE